MWDVPNRLTDWHCALEARETARKVARGYRSSATEDLLRQWIAYHERTFVIIPVTQDSGPAVALTGCRSCRHYVHQTIEVMRQGHPIGRFCQEQTLQLAGPNDRGWSQADANAELLERQLVAIRIS